MMKDLETTLKDTRNISLELLTTQLGPVHTAEKVLHDTAQAYHDDLAERQARLDKQTAEYTTQLSNLRTKQNTLYEQIADLVGRGSMDRAAELDAKLETINQSIVTLDRKKRLTSQAKLKGDPNLYAKAKAANEVLRSETEVYREHLRSIKAAAQAEAKRMEEVYESAERTLLYSGAIPVQFQDFTAVDRHFRDLDRIEREAQEKAEAERKAAEAMSKNKRYILA